MSFSTCETVINLYETFDTKPNTINQLSRQKIITTLFFIFFFDICPLKFFGIKLIFFVCQTIVKNLKQGGTTHLTGDRSAAEYDDYLEEVEDLILGLMGNEQWAKDQRDKYSKENQSEIRKNDALRGLGTNTT